MTETVVIELKEKLNEAIKKRMLSLRQSKTEAVDDIAVPLKVQPRQVWKWLGDEDVIPQNAKDIVLALDTMINEMDKFKSDIRSPVAPVTHLSFQFRAVIQRENLKIIQDDQGNIVIHGPISVDLL